MKKTHTHSHNNDGFSILEAMIAIAVAILVFVGIYQITILSIRTTETNLKKTEAVHRAEELIEITRSLRNDGWSDSIGTLSPGTAYYLVLEDGEWTFSSISPEETEVFTETIEVGDIYRDGDDNISQSGTLDPNTKKITATVSWNDRGVAREESIETYITNFLDN